MIKLNERRARTNAKIVMMGSNTREEEVKCSEGFKAPDLLFKESYRAKTPNELRRSLKNASK